MSNKAKAAGGAKHDAVGEKHEVGAPKHDAGGTKLIVLSAPSGTGKSTLAAMLLKRNPRIKLSISYTTRAPRGEEKNGIHYFFVSETEFQELVARGQFLEYAHVFGKSWYGTARSTVEKMLAAGNHVLFDIDVQGAASLKKSFGSRCVTIFILPPSLPELEARLRNRKTDSPEAIEARLKTAREELKAAPTFDHQLVNHDLEGTYRELERVLEKAGCL
ncbi:MAG: guanylate kinase [Deltaproteobacteria bacterium]|nr:guanylate kinase [Deltaproteobacteria bacterium]